MKLILQIKLEPTQEQADKLLKTIEVFNESANAISEIAWDNKCFNQFSLHYLVYHKIKESSGLTSQLVIRCASKVVNAYKINKKHKAVFKKHGSIVYDSRVLSYKDNTVSIASIAGRLKMPAICWNTDSFKYIKGEADLVYRKGKFFLLQTIDIPDEDEKMTDRFLGIDLGQNDIASTSEGKNYSSKQLKIVRNKYQRVRKSVQSKGTRSSKRLLKRLSGREQRFASITNHTISKSIVETAKRLGFGIALEDLTGIRKARVGKNQRRQQHSWSFYQLRQFIQYKAQLLGIPVVLVNPRYTSKTCNGCKKIGTRSGKSFKCKDCGEFDADINAAKNISQLGMFISHPERQNTFGCVLSI